MSKPTSQDIAASWQLLSTDEIRVKVKKLVADEPDVAERLLLWLTLDRQVQVEGLTAERRVARAAVKEADRYRLLWNSAASCLLHNAEKLARPRGADERRMLAHIHTAHGPISAGSTDGWLDWLDDEARP